MEFPKCRRSLPSKARMHPIEFLADVALELIRWSRKDPYPDPDRDFSLVFLLGMVLLVVVGTTAILRLVTK
jgi:hypothetical protein